MSFYSNEERYKLEPWRSSVRHEESRFPRMSGFLGYGLPSASLRYFGPLKTPVPEEPESLLIESVFPKTAIR